MSPEYEAFLINLNDHTKLVVDLLKHVTTLASGAIVLLATLLDKTQNHRAAVAIPVAIIFLLLSIVTAIRACIHLSWNSAAALDFRGAVMTSPAEKLAEAVSNVLEPHTKRERVAIITTWISTVSFSIGMVAIGVYVVRNAV